MMTMTTNHPQLLPAQLLAYIPPKKKMKKVLTEEVAASLDRVNLCDRKLKSLDGWLDDDAVTLINFYEENHILHDVSHPEYKNKVKNKLWRTNLQRVLLYQCIMFASVFAYRLMLNVSLFCSISTMLYFSVISCV